MKLSELQSKVDNWINEYGVRYFSELTNTVILMEEVGELARIISRKYGEQSSKKNEDNSDLSDEIADVLFVLTCIANQCNVDLEDAVNKNFIKKTQRDSERHKNNPKLNKID